MVKGKYLGQNKCGGYDEWYGLTFECPNCKAQTWEDWKYCSECGGKLTWPDHSGDSEFALKDSPE